MAKQVPTALTPWQRRLSLTAVVVSTIGVGLAYGIGYPITALTFEHWGVSPWLNGLVGSAPSLAILLCLPFFPRLVGWLGTIRAIVLGCILVGAGFLLMPLLPTPEAWLVLRFAMGIGLALPWLVGETWINTVTTDATRGRMLALYVIALFCGFLIGPMLLDRVGIDGWVPFLIGALGILLATVPIVLAGRLAPRMPIAPSTNVWGAIALAPVAMVAGVIGGLVELGHMALLPVYALHAGSAQSDALRLLTIFMIGGITLQFAVGWLADRASAKVVLIGAALCFALIAATLPLTGDGAVRAAAVFVMGGLGVGFYTLGLTHIGQRVGIENLAVANAAYLITYQIGAMTGPAVGGLAMEIWRPHGFVAAMAAATVIGAIAMVVIGKVAAARSAMARSPGE